MRDDENDEDAILEARLDRLLALSRLTDADRETVSRLEASQRSGILTSLEHMRLQREDLIEAGAA